ncbi:MAG: DNA polymerase III subunit gamma/tau [Bacteroidales bacterium]|nr:DNA polymerase III subunit gamma/tau [Bacteroidales bacterium]
MEEYIVSARKYRPATFRSVIGQHALTTTLKNAIVSNKLAHAYLFCGPRGVGKTTCARIFAKTINCLHPTKEHEACNECESCLAFNEQRSYNIHELDAASNNSVDDIRTLTDQVRIPPQVGKYKVYIIDEVHMLSQSAFNAFLKTLEEPPAHTIFILATTEKYKILPTILSRCQTYDFNRITQKDIVEHLQYVAEQEQISADPEALSVIAQKADGGMRDALSIFDQLASFTGGKITYEQVIQNLNVLDFDYYFRMTDLFLAHKVGECMIIFDEILNKGFDAQHFIGGLASHFRDLLVAHDAFTLKLLDCSDAIKARYMEQAKLCSDAFLFAAIEICNECDMQYKQSRNKRLLVELTLIRLSQLGEEKKKVTGKEYRPIEPIFSQAAESAVHVRPAPVQKTAEQKTAPKGEINQASQATSITQPQEAPPVAPFPTQNRVQQPKKDLPKITTISLRASRAKGVDPNEGNDSQATQTVRKKSYTQADLEFAWREYVSDKPEEYHLSEVMKEFIPVAEANNTVVLTLYNQIDEKLIQEHNSSICQFLREKLSNDQIILHIERKELSDDQKIFTQKEKFEYLLQNNEALVKLCDRFKLRLY